MLIENQPDYEGEPHATVLLHDIHGEYTASLNAQPIFAPTTEGKSDLKDTVRCEVIWDQYELEHTIERMELVKGEGAAEDHVLAAFHALFGDKLDPLIEHSNPYTIWQISGSWKGLERAFEALHADLMPTPSSYTLEGKTHEYWQPSGDDSVFDYWPNTVDMLWMFAQDLDDAMVIHTHKQRVWDLLDAMVEVGAWDDYLPGGESEFEWQATERWGYYGKKV